MKRTKYIFVLTLCLFLAACGAKPAEAPPEADLSEPPAVSEPEASTPDISEPDVSEPDVSEPPAEEPLPPLTEADKDAAYDAACDYYLGTVFDVHKLVEISPREGEISFRVECSKDGVRVDPDRTISLERKNDTWSVVNEGY